MHALQKLFFLKWCTCNFLIRLKSIAARLRARSLSLFIIRRCLTVAHWARCGCSDFCSFLSQVWLSRRPAVRLFCAELCGAGELVSENCNHKYSYSHVPVIRVRPLCAICRELWSAARCWRACKLSTGSQCQCGVVALLVLSEYEAAGPLQWPNFLIRQFGQKLLIASLNRLGVGTAAHTLAVLSLR